MHNEYICLDIVVEALFLKASVPPQNYSKQFFPPPSKLLGKMGLVCVVWWPRQSATQPDNPGLKTSLAMNFSLYITEDGGWV